MYPIPGKMPGAHQLVRRFGAQTALRCYAPTGGRQGFFSEQYLAIILYAMEPKPPACPCCRGRPIRDRARKATQCPISSQMSSFHMS